MDRPREPSPDALRLSQSKVVDLRVDADVAVSLRGNPTSHDVLEEFSEPLDGQVLLDDEARAEASQDWGKIVRLTPSAVVRPSSTSDVVRTVQYCRRHGIKVAPRGNGYSVFGLAEVDNGVVLDMRSLAGIEVDVEHARAYVHAGALWSDVVNAATQHRLTPPVLPSVLHLSVGGTLAGGGIGDTSARFGALNDNVHELDVVTGAGELMTCSRVDNPDLFYATVAGLGQCSIIVRAAVELVPSPRMVRVYQLYYPDWKTLIRDMRAARADGRFDCLSFEAFQSAWAELLGRPETSAGWLYSLQGSIYHDAIALPDDSAVLGELRHENAQIIDLPYLDFTDRFRMSGDFLRANGTWDGPQPLVTLFLPESALEAYAAHLGSLTKDDVGTWGIVYGVPLLRSRIHAPLIRLPDEPITWAFILTRFAMDPSEMVPANRQLYERSQRLGGVLDPYFSAVPMTPEDWRDHFGRAWPAFEAAKRRFDPANILTPGPGIFRK